MHLPPSRSCVLVRMQCSFPFRFNAVFMIAYSACMCVCILHAGACVHCTLNQKFIACTLEILSGLMLKINLCRFGNCTKQNFITSCETTCLLISFVQYRHPQPHSHACNSGTLQSWKNISNTFHAFRLTCSIANFAD